MTMHPKDIYAFIVLAFIVLFVSGLGLAVNDHSAWKHALAYSGITFVIAVLFRGWFHEEIKG